MFKSLRHQSTKKNNKNYSRMANSASNGERNLAEDVGFAAVFLLFHIVHTHES